MGMLKKPDDETVVCESGHHYDSLVEIAGPKDVRMPVNTSEAVSFLHDLEHLFIEHDPGNFTQALETGGPLFRVVVMRLNSGLAVVVPYLNHIFADGCTYYMVLEAIDAAINSRVMSPLQWRTAEVDVGVPSVYSVEDVDLALNGWLPGYVEKMMRYQPGTDSERVADVKEIDPEAIKQLKTRLQVAAEAQGLEFLGTNDFIMAGQSELLCEESIQIMLVNMRDRMPGITASFAGNFERPAFAPTTKDPIFWRSFQKHWAYYGVEGNPRLASPSVSQQVAACNMGIVTNWTSLTRFIQPSGTTLLGHCCTKGFVAGFAGLDVAVVFKGDAEGTLFYIDNFTVGKRGEELKERIQTSDIFNKLFKVEPVPPSPSALRGGDSIRSLDDVAGTFEKVHSLSRSFLGM